MKALLLLASLSLGTPPYEAPEVAQSAGIMNCNIQFEELNAEVSLLYPNGQVVEITCGWPESADDIWLMLWDAVMPHVTDFSQIADFYNSEGSLEQNRSWTVVLMP